MGTRPLASRLDGDPETEPTIAVFPDGSVDTFFDVTIGGDPLTSSEAFIEAIEAAGTAVFDLHRTAVEPGGHATNIAAQADCLGNQVRLAGHLDDPIFSALPFETISMGEPAAVSILGFHEKDVLAVENSSDLKDWTLDGLRWALGDAIQEFLTADVVCCVNWTSIEGFLGALSSLAAMDVEGDWFVLDPGAPAGRSTQDIVDLFEVLERLSSQYNVVLAGNPHEMEVVADALDGPTDGLETALPHLRRQAGLAGVVGHGESRAVAATPDDVVTVANFDVDVSRQTGGGDRFDAGVAHALARKWPWSDALRLGNACASWYVATGESATQGDLAAFIHERD